MTEVEEPLSVTEAARRLGLSPEETFDLVFTRQLRSVPSAGGRPLVPVDAITSWLADHAPSR